MLRCRSYGERLACTNRRQFWKSPQEAEIEPLQLRGRSEDWTDLGPEGDGHSLYFVTLTGFQSSDRVAFPTLKRAFRHGAEDRRDMYEFLLVPSRHQRGFVSQFQPCATELPKVTVLFFVYI